LLARIAVLQQQEMQIYCPQMSVLSMVKAALPKSYTQDLVFLDRCTAHFKTKADRESQDEELVVKRIMTNPRNACGTARNSPEHPRNRTEQSGTVGNSPENHQNTSGTVAFNHLGANKGSNLGLSLNEWGNAGMGNAITSF
jgi:hypothetical protein